jgi:uncharacterized protein YecT (DUF1311 family)
MKDSCNICGNSVEDLEESHICGVPICEECGEEHIRQIDKELNSALRLLKV